MGYNGYPDWMLAETRDKVKDRSETEVVEEREEKVVTSGEKEKRNKRPVVIPYVKGISEELKRIFGSFGITTCFKPTNTLRQLLVRPKDPVGKDKVVGPVYHISCEDCDASYVGETERSLRARFGEHRRPSSTTSEVSKHIHSEQPQPFHQVEQYKDISCGVKMV